MSKITVTDVRIVAGDKAGAGGITIAMLEDYFGKRKPSGMRKQEFAKHILKEKGLPIRSPPGSPAAKRGRSRSPKGRGSPKRGKSRSPSRERKSPSRKKTPSPIRKPASPRGSPKKAPGSPRKRGTSPSTLKKIPLEELNSREFLEGYTIPELQALARARGLPTKGKLNKSDYIEVLLQAIRSKMVGGGIAPLMECPPSLARVSALTKSPLRTPLSGMQRTPSIGGLRRTPSGEVPPFGARMSTFGGLGPAAQAGRIDIPGIAGTVGGILPDRKEEKIPFVRVPSAERNYDQPLPLVRRPSSPRRSPVRAPVVPLPRVPSPLVHPSVGGIAAGLGRASSRASPADAFRSQLDRMSKAELKIIECLFNPKTSPGQPPEYNALHSEAVGQMNRFI